MSADLPDPLAGRALSLVQHPAPIPIPIPRQREPFLPVLLALIQPTPISFVGC